MELIPDLDASWMRRVSVTGMIGDNRVERVGFSVATQTGPVSVMRVSDLRGIEIDSDAAIGDADGHRVEAKLASALAAEIHAVAKGVEDVDANKRASAEQLVLSHEIAAAYMETASGANDADDLHRRLRDELIPNRPHGLLVRMRPARLAHRTPMLSETSFRGILGEEANVHISLPQLKGAEIKIDAVIREMRRQGEEMYREEAVTRLRRKISRY